MITLNQYQKNALKTAIFPKEQGLMYTALKLGGETGEVLEHIGKSIRDDDGAITEERLADLKGELGDVLWYLAALTNELGLTLEEVAAHNLAKLADRQARNALRGSGSNR